MGFVSFELLTKEDAQMRERVAWVVDIERCPYHTR